MIENAVDALLRVPAITAAVGQRIALHQLPQGSAAPALVYQVIDSTGIQQLCQPVKTFYSRVQVNPLAASPTEVNALHLLVRTALESDAPRTVGITRVAACRFLSYGPATKDEFTGMWTKPADYMLTHE